MILFINLLNFLLLHLYFILIAVYGFLFWRKTNDSVHFLEKYKRPLIICVLVFHSLYFLFRMIEYRHPPITNVFETLTLLAFGITLVYFYIEYKIKDTDTGFFVFVVAGVVQLISTLFIKELTDINPVLKNWLLGVHVSTAIFGYSGIIISGIYGYLYLRLYKQIKRNRSNAFYKRLPPLETLKRLTMSSILFGFIFFTLAIIIGFVWLPKAIESYSYADPKLIVSSIIWIFYAAGYLRTRSGSFSNKNLMRLALAGFLFSIISMLFVNFFVKSFHNFYY